MAGDLKSATEAKRALVADRDFVWHPFTPMRFWNGDASLVIERGQGCYLFDTEGRRYFDGVSSLWVTVHGHGNPQLDEALRDQLSKVAHSTLLGLGNVPSSLLAEELVAAAPHGLCRVFYSDSGSTAVEVALKMAFQYWQQVEPSTKVPNPKGKTLFAALGQSYHGDTLGAVSVGGIDLFHQIYKPLMLETVRLPSPSCYRCELGKQRETCEKACIEEARRILTERKNEIAALILEPRIQGAAGMLKSVEGHLRAMREICTELDILLIVDEVATGFGRTGSLFACTKEKVTPDLLCLAKGISGGYLPLAATLATGKVYEAFLGEVGELKTFFHGHTYTGNPLACAVARASLSLFQAEGFWEQLQTKIAVVEDALQVFRDHLQVGDVRQEGLMVGIEMVKDRALKTPYPYEEQVGAKVCRKARDYGLLVRPLGNVLVFMPPLSATTEELREALGALYRALTDLLPA